ncbi:MAG: PhnD/SsuA/transferrin family substrate-binding protein [Betaproteobacteria bacterium]|jgi:hypothetical protein|nr:PhnD/SsuA/transferrin family substrate-binding protein [Betaproteobacteria bacterium]MBK7655692.1 PhnD/SsuA/transferrin family substrate-binding protein [Betaproteobacteria bacterium]MBP6645169.1 PhnD/SsuA/transferrin family substrate-binding protein [Burkholderiaceae bacterium]
MKRCRWCLVMAFVLLLCSRNGAFADAPPPIAIGFYNPVIRDVPRKDVEVTLRFWADELGASIKVPFKPIRFYDSLSDMRRDLKAGEINFIVGTSMGVAQIFPNEELRDGFSGLKNQPDHLLLVVRRASGIQRPGDLADKRIALLDGDELSEVYLEVLLMKAWAKPDETRLASIHREKRSSTLVHHLFFNQVDAALVKRNTYDAAVAMNPQVGKQVMVLEDYTFKGRSPHIALFSSRVAPQHAEAITKSVLTLGQTARGRQLLDIYNADSMVVTRVQDLDPFRELLNQHRVLKATAGSAPKKVAR